MSGSCRKRGSIRTVFGRSGMQGSSRDGWENSWLYPRAWHRGPLHLPRRRAGLSLFHLSCALFTLVQVVRCGFYVDLLVLIGVVHVGAEKGTAARWRCVRIGHAMPWLSADHPAMAGAHKSTVDVRFHHFVFLICSRRRDRHVPQGPR